MVGNPQFDAHEVVEACAALHPWIRLVVRAYYAPPLMTARAATREIVGDLELARRVPNEDPAGRLRHAAHAVRRIPEITDALEPDDVEDSLDRVFEPSVEAARTLGLDVTTVIFPVLEIIPVMDGTLTAITELAGGFVAAVDRLLGPGGDGPGSVDRAIDRALLFDRAVGDVLFALDDFTGSDLGDADLTGIPLDGVLWSRGTRWPSDVRRRIERDSVAVGGGVFEVHETADRRDAWTVTRDEAEHMAQLWATAGQSTAYPLVGSVVAEFDLGYVLGERLAEGYAPLSRPRWAVVDRVTGDLRTWQQESWDRLSADTVVDQFRTWRTQRPPTTRTWDARDPAATPSYVTYLVAQPPSHGARPLGTGVRCHAGRHAPAPSAGPAVPRHTAARGPFGRLLGGRRAVGRPARRGRRPGRGRAAAPHAAAGPRPDPGQRRPADVPAARSGWPGPRRARTTVPLV